MGQGLLLASLRGRHLPYRPQAQGFEGLRNHRGIADDNELQGGGMQDPGMREHMMQMRTKQAADVRAVLPGARSVVVVGTLYNVVPDANPVTADGLARIARYAGGDDYHDILRVRINMLVAWMEQASPEPFEARAFVDSGPVQERVYAQYAGLGWIGKNTCLINPELGSFLFLSEIICTLPLEPDTQGLDGCGTCTRCIEACPSGALVEPYVLDATRCLSYLTIELRGGIEPSLRPAMGAHVFGCDICQTVCPYNQPPHLASDPTWRPRPELVSPRLEIGRAHV